MQILYEDNHIIGVVKEPGVLSQADASGADDMLTLVKDDIKIRYSKPGNVFLGLVHRLDRNVGGAMLFAKTSKGASRLSKEMREKRFYKAYLAVVNGDYPLADGEDIILTNYLVKDEKQNRVSENDKSGKKSLLRVVKIAVREGKTLLLALPITGRTHQIRAQLALVGYPILGDRKYGSDYVSKKGHEDFGLWSSHIVVKKTTSDDYLHIVCVPRSDGVWKNFDAEINFTKNISREQIIKWFTI